MQTGLALKDSRKNSGKLSAFSFCLISHPDLKIKKLAVRMSTGADNKKRRKKESLHKESRNSAFAF